MSKFISVMAAIVMSLFLFIPVSAASFSDPSISYSANLWAANFWYEDFDYDTNHYSITEVRAQATVLSNPEHYKFICIGSGYPSSSLDFVGYYAFNLLNHLDVSKDGTFDITVNASFNDDFDNIYLMCSTPQAFQNIRSTLLNGANISVSDSFDLIAQSIEDNVNVPGVYGCKLFNWVNGYFNYTIPVHFPTDFNGLVYLYLIGVDYGRNVASAEIAPSTVKITPTGDTLVLWKQLYYQEEVIGSEEGGGLKGIFEKIKQLPTKILDGIKSIFVPEEGFIDSFRSHMEELLADHLGFVWQAPQFLNDIFQNIINYDPPDSNYIPDYDLTIPSKSFYISVENGDVNTNGFHIDENSFSGSSEFVLVPDQGDGYYHIDLSFFETGWGMAFWYLYRSLMTMLIIFSVILCGWRMYNKIFSADGGD